MADHVAVFRLDNKTTCCLFFGVKLYFFNTFPRARGLIKLFITPHNQFQVFYFFLISLYKVNQTPMYTKKDQTPTYTGKKTKPLRIKGEDNKTTSHT